MDGKNSCKCDSRIIGNNATANTIPTVIHSNAQNEQSHEATTGAIDKDALLFLMQNGIEEDEAIALIICSMASPIISRLPMEFLVESKQLIQMALKKE
jgi:Fe-S cluster assembly protein SufB